MHSRRLSRLRTPVCSSTAFSLGGNLQLHATARTEAARGIVASKPALERTSNSGLHRLSAFAELLR